MRQNVILAILIFVTTTTAIYAQTNTGWFGKCALRNPDFNYQSQLQNFSFATSTKLTLSGDLGYAGTKPDATLKLTTEWKWEDGEMQILTKPRKIQIPSFQFAVDDSNSNANALMKLGLVATSLYLDHKRLELSKNGRYMPPFRPMF